MVMATVKKGKPDLRKKGELPFLVGLDAADGVGRGWWGRRRLLESAGAEDGCSSWVHRVAVLREAPSVSPSCRDGVLRGATG